MKDIRTLINDFCGEYDATWIERSGEFENCQLDITKDGQKGGYFLTWFTDKTIHWEGYGMHAGDLLVGGYC